MRADRLVAILLMLQQREQVTAQQVADELEISERTARRDLDALGVAGLPIYSTRGRNGGWRLLGGGRTDLSGLTSGEARALFRIAGPAASATPEVRAALRKLVRALPEPFRPAAEAATASIVVDPHGWDGRVDRPPPALLDEAQHAVVEGRRTQLEYRSRGGAVTERMVDPLGLAAKGRSWYLVAATADGLRTFRVDRILSLTLTDEPVARPDGFELSEAWRLITDEVDQRRTPAVARLAVAPEMVPWLRNTVDHRLRVGGAGVDGRVEVEIRGYTAETIAAELAGFAEKVEVIDPPEVRDVLARIGSSLTTLYGSTNGPTGREPT